MSNESENQPARRVDDKRAEVPLSWSDFANAYPVPAAAAASAQPAQREVPEYTGLDAIARVFADVANTSGQVVLSAQSCDLLYRAMTTPLAAPAAHAHAELIELAPPLTAPAPLTEGGTSEQQARFAIDGAIQYGRENRNPPPSTDHWLYEYWNIGRQLAKLGETGWDNVTPMEAAPAPQQSEGLSDERITELARIEADEDEYAFTLNKDGRFSVISFARAIEREVAKAAPAAPVQTAVSVPRATLLMIYEAMNYMGDKLNGMDACEDEDEDATTPAFDAIRALLDDSYVAAPVQAEQAQAEPTPLDYRAQGREEALAIILAEDAENPFADYTHDYQVGDTGDYGTDWDEKALRELLHIGDRKHDAYDRAEAQYWDYLGKSEEAERMTRMVERAPFYKPLHDFLAEHEAWHLFSLLQDSAAPALPAQAEQAAAVRAADVQTLRDTAGILERESYRMHAMSLRSMANRFAAPSTATSNDTGALGEKEGDE
jgi:hypothetical protein